MAARIVHFGIDECGRIPVLARSGYLVDACGTSVSNLKAALQEGMTDGVIFSEDAAQSIHQPVVTVARSLSSAPLILFEGVARNYNLSDFDLVIPPTASPANWLKRIADMLEKSRAIHFHSHSVREISTRLREQSARLREESARLRHSVASERERRLDRMSVRPAMQYSRGDFERIVLRDGLPDDHLLASACRFCRRVVAFSEHSDELQQFEQTLFVSKCATPIENMNWNDGGAS